jgi:hypothetical protein
MFPPKVSRSTMAAHNLGSVKVLVQPENDSLEAIATEFFSSRSVRTWKQELGTAAVELHISELVDAEQVDAAVAGDGLVQRHLVGGFDELVHEASSEGVLHPEPGLGGRGSQADEQVGLAGARVTDQAQRLPGADPGGAGQGVDGGGVDVRVGVESKSSSHFSRGKPAALTRRAVRRRARSSHSASSSSARKPR